MSRTCERLWQLTVSFTICLPHSAVVWICLTQRATPAMALCVWLDDSGLFLKRCSRIGAASVYSASFCTFHAPVYAYFNCQQNVFCDHVSLCSLVAAAVWSRDGGVKRVYFLTSNICAFLTAVCTASIMFWLTHRNWFQQAEASVRWQSHPGKLTCLGLTEQVSVRKTSEFSRLFSMNVINQSQRLFILLCSASIYFTIFY